MKIKFEWEEIVYNLYRARVMGGWLMREAYSDENGSLAFIPDPNHEWEIDND